MDMVFIIHPRKRRCGCVFAFPLMSSRSVPSLPPKWVSNNVAIGYNSGLRLASLEYSAYNTPIMVAVEMQRDETYTI
jgi:hypothetical protein